MFHPGALNLQYYHLISLLLQPYPRTEQFLLRPFVPIPSQVSPIYPDISLGEILHIQICVSYLLKVESGYPQKRIVSKHKITGRFHCLICHGELVHFERAEVVSFDEIKLYQTLNITVDQMTIIYMPHSFDQNLDAADRIWACDVYDVEARDTSVEGVGWGSVNIHDCVVSECGVEAVISFAHVGLIHNNPLVVHLELVRLEICKLSSIHSLSQVVNQSCIWFWSERWDADHLVWGRRIRNLPFSVLLEEISERCKLLTRGPLLVDGCIIVI